MKLNNISYPVNLGTSQWGTASLGQLVYVDTGDLTFPITCNYDWGGAGGYLCTTNFTLWWVGNQQFALQVADNQYNCLNSHVGLYATFSRNNGYWEAWDSSISSPSTFGLENLGGGNVAITYAGNYLNQTDNWHDWGFNIIIYGSTPTPPDPSTIFSTGHPHFHILLICGAGVGLNLTGQNFADGGYVHSLSATDFTGANLTNANLSTLPDLSVASCKFNGATLTGAILKGVRDLNKATWTSAILANTDLSKVDPAGVTGIDFSTLASEKPVDLTGATLGNGKPLGANFNYGAANFNRANLTNAIMDGTGLAGAHFTGATLTGTHLNGADLTGADLTGADLTGAKLAGTILTGATLSGTIFDHCDLSTAKFGPAPKFGTSIGTRTRFRSATVPATSLGLNWSYLDLSGATIADIPQSITSLNADAALLPDQLNLQGVDLDQATFRGTRMYGIQLQRANLHKATMTDALLKGARLNEANLTLADLSRAWLIVEPAGPKTPVNQLEAASVTDAFMFNTVLDQAHCDGVDFSRANFSTSGLLSTKQSASAVGAYMNDTKFNDAWVAGAIFNGAQLSGANLANAHLIGTLFQNDGSVATELTPSIRNIGIAATTVNADISGTNFTGANMDGLDMDGAVVATTGATFTKQFTGYKSAKVLVTFNYGPTKFGNTTANTICPNGSSGPCSV
jgi:uncharacterized protein YjbI with pentapeptide repeats